MRLQALATIHLDAVNGRTMHLQIKRLHDKQDGKSTNVEFAVYEGSARVAEGEETLQNFQKLFHMMANS